MANPIDYEVLCVETNIEHLSSHFPTSKKYCETAVRKFFKNQEKELEPFQNAEAALRESNWEELNAGKCSFEEIEVDCLLHVYQENPTVDILFTPPIFHISPTNAWLKNHTAAAAKIFDKKIFDNAIESEESDKISNAYAVFEISIDSNIFIQKLGQLERDLTLLLYRQRLKSPNVNVNVQDIVRFAGIATPKADISKIRKFIEKEKNKVPLLTTLYTLNRVVVVKVKVDRTYTAKKLATFNSLSDTISSISILDEEIKIATLRKVNAETEKILLEKQILEEQKTIWKEEKEERERIRIRNEEKEERVRNEETKERERVRNEEREEREKIRTEEREEREKKEKRVLLKDLLNSGKNLEDAEIILNGFGY